MALLRTDPVYPTLSVGRIVAIPLALVAAIGWFLKAFAVFVLPWIIGGLLFSGLLGPEWFAFGALAGFGLILWFRR